MDPFLFGGWLFFRLFVFALIALAFMLIWRRGRLGCHREEHYQYQQQKQQSSPEDVLRGRFARGDINRQQFREALVELLKDRYVRGELTLEEYEARLSLLVGETD